MRSGDVETLMLFADLELSVGDLYRAFSRQFVEEENFWVDLAHEEDQHQQWILALKEGVEEGNVKVDATGIDPEQIRQTIEKLSELKAMAEEGELSLRSALEAALNLETSLIEGKIFNLFLKHSDKGGEVRDELLSATNTHALKVKVRIEEIWGEDAVNPRHRAFLEEQPANGSIVAACGLVCSACRSFLDEKCKGCKENVKATWCKVRECCAYLDYRTCAECVEFTTPRDCGKFNNFFSKLYGFFQNSDRAACILQIRELGVEGHAKKMMKSHKKTIPRH